MEENKETPGSSEEIAKKEGKADDGWWQKLRRAMSSVWSKAIAAGRRLLQQELILNFLLLVFGVLVICAIYWALRIIFERVIFAAPHGGLYYWVIILFIIIIGLLALALGRSSQDILHDIGVVIALIVATFFTTTFVICLGAALKNLQKAEEMIDSGRILWLGFGSIALNMVALNRTFAWLNVLYRDRDLLPSPSLKWATLLQSFKTHLANLRRSFRSLSNFRNFLANLHRPRFLVGMFMFALSAVTCAGNCVPLSHHLQKTLGTAITSTPTPTATSTPQPTATDTPVPTATSTPVPTATNMPVLTATSTSTPTATNTPVPTATSTSTPTATSTPQPTSTPVPMPSATPTEAMPRLTLTPTPRPTLTPTPRPTPTSMPTPPSTSEGTPSISEEPSPTSEKPPSTSEESSPAFEEPSPTSEEPPSSQEEPPPGLLVSGVTGIFAVLGLGSPPKCGRRETA